jgi:nucleoside-diphosphate-sugar epimerase
MENAALGAVLVTGLSGLIGNAVARALVARGDTVIGLDRAAPPAPPCPVMLHELGDAHRLHEIVAGADIRAIIHAGGASGPMVWPESPARIAAINIGGTTDMLEAARIHRIGRVVWFSSMAVYPEDGGTAALNEDTVLRSPSVYGATKIAGEALLEAYAQAHGVDGVALRVASCYGPGRTTNCFIRLLVENALAGRPTRVPDLHARTRQHIHIDDVVAATLAALDRPNLPHRAYNIGPGTALTSSEVADAVAQTIAGVRLEQDATAANWNAFAIGTMDIARARRDLGFEPCVGLGEGALTYRGWIASRQAA